MANTNDDRIKVWYGDDLRISFENNIDDERKINSDNLYKMIKDNVNDSKIITVPSDYEERRSKAKAFIESIVNGTEF